MTQISKLKVNHLKSVPKTLLVTLKAKYEASIDPSYSFKDPFLESLYEKIDDPLKESDLFFILKRGVILRTKAFDYLLKKEIKKREIPPTIIHLPCGLDTRYHRLSEKLGPCQWYDCDLPEVIKIRKNFFKEKTHYKMREIDILDPNWPKAISNVSDPIILMEGLSMYLDHDKLQLFFHSLSTFFNHYCLILDFISPFFVHKEWMLPAMEQFDVRFSWGTKRGKDFQVFDSKLSCEEELGLLDPYKKFIPFGDKIISTLFDQKNMALLRR